MNYLKGKEKGVHGRPSTLFDEFLIGMSGVPSRFKEGMLILDCSCCNKRGI